MASATTPLIRNDRVLSGHRDMRTPVEDFVRKGIESIGLRMISATCSRKTLHPDRLSYLAKQHRRARQALIEKRANIQLPRRATPRSGQSPPPFWFAMKPANTRHQDDDFCNTLKMQVRRLRLCRVQRPPLCQARNRDRANTACVFHSVILLGHLHRPQVARSVNSAATPLPQTARMYSIIMSLRGS